MELPKVNFASEAVVRKIVASSSMWEKARSLSKSVTHWALEGAPVAGSEMFNRRIEECKRCEHWAGESFANTGKCKICGCSTQLKLRMATEKCPIGKW